MKYYPTYETVCKFAENPEYRIVPVCTEVYSDLYTPIELLLILKAVSNHCYMLESVEDSKRWGRYSFLGFDPTLEITCRNHQMKIKDADREECFETAHPGKILKKIMKDYKSPNLDEFPSFTGGLVGYFSYDYIKYAEPVLRLDAKDENHFQDMDLMLFDKVIAIDHFRQKIILIHNMKLQGDLEKSYQDSVAELEKMRTLIQNGKKAEIVPLKLKSGFTPHFSREEYCRMVETAKERIYEGDIFQVVLANRMEAEMEGSILNTYRVLRTTNPSPYMFYFSSDDIEIAGASPETLAKLENGTLYTFPLAGTRKRGATEEEDQKLEEELLKDEKELAEHNMLVDLGRNDIGKISEIGTVEVEKYMEIQKFSHVMHIGSTVHGKIREGKDAVDTVDAILPAGTLSGAPKIKACQIINELEDLKRGIYGGAIGYLDFTGNLDTCIAIRMAYAKNGKVFVCSGAGIVADSIPENEFQECINKAKAVTDALQISGKGEAL